MQRVISLKGINKKNLVITSLALKLKMAQLLYVLLKKKG